MNIVSITACPAGLAHTPMAAAALEKAGKKMNYNIKVEQQGVMGQVNQISYEEAQAADFVLLATDQKIEGMERFEGKKIMKVNIDTAIANPEAVLRKCVEAIKNN